jgi:hypothetical protein
MNLKIKKKSYVDLFNFVDEQVHYISMDSIKEVKPPEKSTSYKTNNKALNVNRNYMQHI